MKFELKHSLLRPAVAILCAIIVAPGETLAFMPQLSPGMAPGGQTFKLSPGQLDSLVAPVALYPDPLLAQVLAASTYPIEIVELQQWLGKNKNLKGQALADAAMKQPWDPSVQALAPLPDVVQLLATNIQWTTDLGNAFLAQESDMMNAVQSMRRKAQANGALESTPQQTVQTQQFDGTSAVVIDPANSDVLYVPQYQPLAVFGEPAYPYPAFYYPPGYDVAGTAIAFGLGVAMGAWWGGGWGWGCGWGGGNVYVNNRNTFINNGRGGVGGVGRPGGIGGIGRPGGVGGIGGIGRPGGVGGLGGNRPSTLPALSNWAHNPAHRGGTPYSDRTTANRFGGTARGDSLMQRQAGARQQINRQGGNLTTKPPAAGLTNRPGGAGAAGTGGASRVGRPGVGAPGAVGPGGANRIGNRNPSPAGGAGQNAIGGGSRGYNGPGALGNANRGGPSMGSANRSVNPGGGGFRGGGGGFRGGGGGFRGGGGGFRGGGGRGGGRRR